MAGAGCGRVQAPLAPIPERFQGWLLTLVHSLLPLLLRLRLLPWLPAGIEAVEVAGGAALAEAYQRFQRGEIRLLLAVRHSAVDDPLCALQLLGRQLPKLARRQGIALQKPLHAHFLYDRGMPLWGGRGLGWLLARLGGVSLRRGRQPDWTALRQARALLLHGRLPLALAPEGATNGLSERIGPLENGAAQLALWALADLQRSGRREAVWIVPIGIQYIYPRPPWHRFDRLLARLERALGLPEPAAPAAGTRCRRLRRIGTSLLAALEAFHGLSPAADGALDARLERLRQEGLRQAEAPFALAAGGSCERRCRRIEEAAWQRIHRDDLPPRHRLTPLQRALADHQAREAELVLQRMRVIETLVAVNGTYVVEHPSFERCAETAQLLAAALDQLRNRPQAWRPRLGWRRALVTVAQPLVLEQGPSSKAERKSDRGRVEAITDAIRSAFQASLR